MSRISLLLHESEVEPRMSVNNKDILRVWWGFNWLLSQCFDLSCFLSKLCVGIGKWKRRTRTERGHELGRANSDTESNVSFCRANMFW